MLLKRISNAITKYEDLYAIYLSRHKIPFLRQEVICLDCGYHANTIRIRCPKCKSPHPEVAVVDFLVPAIRLVIEIGGGYIDNDKLRLKDANRTKSLNSCKYQVIRISNKEVMELWNNLSKAPHFWEPK